MIAILILKGGCLCQNLQRNKKRKGRILPKRLEMRCGIQVHLQWFLFWQFILICGTAFIFLLFYSAEESKDQYLADEQARAYYPSEGETCGDCEYGVDLADLGVELLDYEAYYRNEWGTEGYAPYTTCEYIFSTKDALESPAIVYTLL